jgi:triphosphatase
MATETEMKLAMTPGTGDAVLNHPMVQQAASGELAEKRLISVYFDTKGLELKARKVAIRVRRKGDRFVQTLKTKGTATAGLFVRRELENDVAGEHLELDKVDDAPLRDWLQGLADPLREVFVTDFSRRLLIVHPEGAAKVELCIDEGEVRANGLSEPLNEVELELVEGDVEAMKRFAAKLAAALDLHPDNRSKAERGYGLFSASL